MKIEANLVKKLRDITGLGFSICKEALIESNGDLEISQKLLREKGLNMASKRSNKETLEGIIKVYINSEMKVGVIVEVNCETDFVARNKVFNDFVDEISIEILNSELDDIDVDDFLKLKFKNSEFSIKEILDQKISVIGENISIRRFKKIRSKENFLYSYVHNGGKIGVLLELNKKSNDDLAKEICMQIASMSPKFISYNDVPEDFINKEKEILIKLAINEGKSSDIAKKMVDGKFKKIIKNLCLLDQEFVKSNNISVSEHIKSLDGDLSIINFIRFERSEKI